MVGGLTSIFLAKEYNATVYAVDLLGSATDNYGRFKEMKIEEYIIPIHADAHELPFSKRQATLDFYKRAGYNKDEKTAFIQWLD